MNTDRVWVLEDPDEQPRARKKSVALPPRPQKSPAAAFSWSILIWGGGQIYRHQGSVGGVLLILLMVNFYADPVIIWLYRDPILAWLKGLAVTSSQMLAAATLFYFSGLLIWLSSADHAYQSINAARTEPFRGIDSSWMPVACSIVLPGWGQFLNGQGKKGALLLLVGLVGYFAVPTMMAIWLFWPYLETATDRLLWEKILIGLIVVVPIVLLIWPLNAFDALKVSLDETKKEPVLKRLEYANNRRRMFGWGRGVFPSFKQTLTLMLLLVFCIAVAYYAFPRDYYVTHLQSLQTHLSQRHMVLIPQLVGRLLHQL